MTSDTDLQAIADGWGKDTIKLNDPKDAQLLTQVYGLCNRDWAGGVRLQEISDSSGVGREELTQRLNGLVHGSFLRSPGDDGKYRPTMRAYRTQDSEYNWLSKVVLALQDAADKELKLPQVANITGIRAHNVVFNLLQRLNGCDVVIVGQARNDTTGKYVTYVSLTPLGRELARYLIAQAAARS